MVPSFYILHSLIKFEKENEKKKFYLPVRFGKFFLSIMPL